MNTVLFFNATIGFSENVFLVIIWSNGGASFIFSKLIGKDTMKMKILMQIFENLLLQNYSTKFLDIAHELCFNMYN